MATLFPLSFFEQDTKTVAQELLGQRLVHSVNGERLSGIIVETEAYLGAEDPACHTFKYRRTVRNESMYLDGGHAYIYLIYGLHYCFNVVTRTSEFPEAVLVRAIEPLEGIKTMQRHRALKSAKKNKDGIPLELTNGPGKLCSALKIDRSCDGLRLNQQPLLIEKFRRSKLTESEFISSPRIGVDYAGNAAKWPLRFSLRGNPFVSKPIPKPSV